MSINTCLLGYGVLLYNSLSNLSSPFDALLRLGLDVDTAGVSAFLLLFGDLVHVQSAV